VRTAYWDSAALSGHEPHPREPPSTAQGTSPGHSRFGDNCIESAIRSRSGPTNVLVWRRVSPHACHVGPIESLRIALNSVLDLFYRPVH
jgi:hypothetical protein